MSGHGEAPGFPKVGLTWGIKRSFIRYISTLADGTHTESGGAYLGDASAFTFPVLSQFEDGEVMRFHGTVRIGGHGGMLGVLLSEPWVEVTGDRGTLSVVDPAKAGSPRQRVALAELKIDRERQDGVQVWRCAARLADAGVDVFAGHYPVGVDLDPVIIT